jgi:hypothetical protein
MDTPVETTLMGWKAWTVIGIICFACSIYLLGVFNSPAQPYIEGAVKTLLNVIPIMK